MSAIGVECGAEAATLSSVVDGGTSTSNTPTSSKSPNFEGICSLIEGMLLDVIEKKTTKTPILVQNIISENYSRRKRLWGEKQTDRLLYKTTHNTYNPECNTRK